MHQYLTRTGVQHAGSLIRYSSSHTRQVHFQTPKFETLQARLAGCYSRLGQL
jgi:hypothetical protein